MLIKNNYSEDCLLSSKDTAYILGMSESHLAIFRTGKKEGGPVFIREGNRYLYSPKSVYDFLLKRFEEPLNNGVKRLDFTLNQIEGNVNAG